jgi:arginine decarboxylase
MKFIPTEVWVVTGKGESNTSRMCAFDRALYDAGVGYCNLVLYSSKIPKKIKWRDFRKELIPGQELKVALARSNGIEGQKITAGIGVAKTNDYSLITELSGTQFPKKIETEIRNQLKEMVDIASLKLKSIKTLISHLEVEKKYGCVVSLVIYNPNTYR